jgi:L-fuconolactonase
MTGGWIDSHHHVWDTRRRRYAFLDAPELAPIRRPFGVAEFGRAARPHGVLGTVLVQAAPALEETEELLAIAGREPLVAGVVGWIDCGADPEDQLRRLRGHPHGGRLVGVRLMAQDEPDPAWLSREPVQAAAEAIGAAGLVCELLVRPAQLAAAVALVARLPAVRFVLDHAGKPPIAAGGWEPWRTEVGNLAAHTNVACKISGLITEGDWRTWTPATIAPYVEAVREAFGDERLLYGSDWPVCLLAGSYAQVIDLARATLAASDPSAVFAGNAQRIYRLSAGNPPVPYR